MYFTVPNLCHLAPLWAYYIHLVSFVYNYFYYYNIIWRFIVNYQLELKQIVDFTLPDLPGIYTNPYERQKHPYQRRFLSFFIFSFYVLMQITAPLIGTSNTLLTKLFLANGSVLLKNSRFTSPAKIQHQVISILDTLVEQNLLTYSLHEKNKIIQYKIKTGQKIILPFPIITHAKKTSGFSFSNRRCS